VNDNKIKVVCVNPHGYYSLTEGKEYEVVEFEPRIIHPHYTFPRYVSVIDDRGKVSTGHAYRFRMLDGISCEDYIRENIPDYRHREG